MKCWGNIEILIDAQPGGIALATCKGLEENRLTV